MIEVRNITKTYKTGDVEFNALNGVSFKIEEFLATSKSYGTFIK
jgi:ABC-type dipeptide/oligopeptide/nickel transport system ATPase subunit